MRIKCWLNMAQTTKLVARYPTYFHGKTLYGIVSNFKNFGVGRTVIRNSLLRYPEPSFYKIVKVELDLSRHFGKTKRFCKVYAHTWFRGEYRGIKGTGAAFKADWRLLQEDELDTFCNLENAPERPVRAVPMYFRAPPLYELHKLQRLKFLNVEAEAPVTLKNSPS
ncbi:uncharacterized protein LOC106155741 [Lingula anatina]|uniref:Uncharacterized protein LOC106155741 n=1 Tax=Lingula anatina TaxID=7574 RepID=A0A1S3HL34_LINAN|nr:uncharacterized protein LOC106155741 [Lingula anatina]|eukprot:XP_013386171.1 uncharacterized protein LOC106155741 [Lingula anatina]